MEKKKHIIWLPVIFRKKSTENTSECDVSQNHWKYKSGWPKLGGLKTRWGSCKPLPSTAVPGNNPFPSSLSSSSSPWSPLHFPLQAWPSLMPTCRAPAPATKKQADARDGTILVWKGCPTCRRRLGVLRWVPAGFEGTGLWLGRGCHCSGGICYSKSDSVSLLRKGDGQDWSASLKGNSPPAAAQDYSDTS